MLDSTIQSENRSTFRHTREPIPHRLRGRKIVAAHPEIKSLIGHNPWTFAFIIAIVGAQLTLAWLLAAADWWLIFAVAFVIGATANHALFVAIHECAHRLVFKNRTPNRLAGIIANVPQILPNSIAFERYHLDHHRYLGVKGLDADVPSALELRLFSDTVVGRAAWIALMPLIQSFRPLSLKTAYGIDAWWAANLIVVLGFDALIVWLWGWTALLYLALSTVFSIGGLHPLSARWIQEHYLIDESGNETFSYYGAANYFDLNMGYHNEHHDMPGVPWNKLPEVKRLAPEYYAPLPCHTSYWRLLLDFVRQGHPTYTSRIVRGDVSGDVAQA